MLYTTGKILLKLIWVLLSLRHAENANLIQRAYSSVMSDRLPL